MANPLASAFGAAPQVDPEEAALDQQFTANKGWAKPGPYSTALSPQEEGQFKSWVLSNKIPYDFTWPADQTKQDYDMRGFWKAQQSGDPQAVQAAANGHFPDTWKTPYHESFSNLSQYALPHAPSWQGNQLYDNTGRMLLTQPSTGKMGRPSKDDIRARQIQDILDRVSSGSTLDVACREIGGFTPSQFRGWAYKEKANRLLWEDARREHAHALFDKMTDLAEELAGGEFGKEDNAKVTALKGAIDTLKHITARLAPDLYAERRAENQGVSITIVSSLPMGPGSQPEAAIDTAFTVIGKLPPPKETDGAG